MLPCVEPLGPFTTVALETRRYPKMFCKSLEKEEETFLKYV